MAKLKEGTTIGEIEIKPNRIRKILLGTEEPDDQEGEDGDIFFQYEDDD